MQEKINPILEYIAATGCTQVWIAKKVGMTSQQLSLSLSGKREIRLREGIRIKKLLGKDYSEKFESWIIKS